MNGEQCLSSILDLYDAAGGIRGRLIDLQHAASTAQSSGKAK